MEEKLDKVELFQNKQSLKEAYSQIFFKGSLFSEKCSKISSSSNFFQFVLQISISANQKAQDRNLEENLEKNDDVVDTYLYKYFRE